MQKSVLLEPPSVAHGGKGVVVAGCPTCKKRINTITDFLDHLTNDVIPELINTVGWGGDAEEGNVVLT